MSSKGAVPDAWDENWEDVADKIPGPKIPRPESPPKLSKAQRKAQHLEQQKQLWDSAENPDRFLWLETKGAVPLKQEFKPQVTLLSRKPAPTIAKRNVTEGVEKLRLDDEDDSEDEARKKREAEFEDRQRKAKLEREEKQRKYAEARERIMGSSNPTSPAPSASDTTQARDSRRQRGKANGTRRSQPDSPSDQSPNRPVIADKQLFDPDDMGRRLLAKRDGTPVPLENAPMRQPRGPDQNARGGFGFGSRGGSSGL